MNILNYSNVIAFENGWSRNTREPAPALKVKDTKNLSWPFLSWFLYDSPYGEFILNRDNFEFCSTNGFIVSGTIPHALLQNIAIISRHFYEIHKDSFVRFNEMTLEKGVDPTIAYAFLFNSYYSYYGDSYLKHPFGIYAGHRVTSAYRPQEFLNLFKGEWGSLAEKRNSGVWRSPSKAGSLFAADEAYYNGFPSWARNNKNFQEALKAYRKPDVNLETYSPPNPFVRNPTLPRILGAGEFTFEECFDFVMPYVDDLIRKELNI